MCYFLLGNKSLQIWYLKAIQLIHSFCGSGIGLKLSSWVPLTQNLSKRQPRYEPRQQSFQSSFGGESNSRFTQWPDANLSPRGCGAEGFNSLLPVDPLGLLHRVPHSMATGFLQNVYLRHSHALLNITVQGTSQCLCLILNVSSENLCSAHNQGEEMNSKDVEILESSQRSCSTINHRPQSD